MGDEEAIDDHFEITVKDEKTLNDTFHIKMVSDEEEGEDNYDEIQSCTCCIKERRQYWCLAINFPLTILFALGVGVTSIVFLFQPIRIVEKVLWVVPFLISIYMFNCICKRRKQYSSIYLKKQRKYTKTHNKSVQEILDWLLYHVPTAEQMEFIKSCLQNSFHKAVQITGEWIGTDFVLSFGGSFPERLSIPRIPAVLEYDENHAIVSDIDFMLTPKHELASFTQNKERYFVKATVTPGFVFVYDNRSGEQLTPLGIKEKVAKCIKEFDYTLVQGTLSSSTRRLSKYEGPAVNTKVIIEDPLFPELRKTVSNLDLTFSLKCRDWPDYLCDWAFRPNKKWPTFDDINRIKAEGIHIVPKSRKNALKGVAWRLSFTNAEIMLMNMVPEIARKCLIGLKVINKDFLKPLCEKLKSYHLKCIFLYKLEREGVEIFQQQCIEKFFQSLLKDLENCLQNKSCQNFWISQINLFEEITISEKSALLNRLQKIQDNPSAFIEPFMREPPTDVEEDDDGVDRKKCCCLFIKRKELPQVVPRISCGELLIKKYETFEDMDEHIRDILWKYKLL